jgi:nucleotidyltransferase substrate binding protein (TIGR01987 family)
MERLGLAKKSLSSLDEALKLPYSELIRDASIHRFKSNLEAVWKLAQRYLALQEGLELGSPKAVIRGCFQAGLLDEKQTEILLQAVDDRNLTVHTYNEALAEKIYQNLIQYQPALNQIYEAIRARVESSQN